METLYLKGTDRDLDRAAAIIKGGGLVAFPTETVYGLGADALNANAVAKIYEAKGRPADNPTIVTIADVSDLETLTPEVTEDMKKLAEAFWPGPMTMVVPAAPIIPAITIAGLKTAGIRMPDNALTRELIRRSKPLAGPSANRSKRPSPTTAQHVLEDMDGRIDAVLDGGTCRVGIESTIIDLSGDVPMILRPGMIIRSQFEEVLGKKVLLDPTLNRDPSEAANDTSDFHPKAPGMKYKHYAPKAPMLLFEGPYEKVLAEIDVVRKAHEEKGERVYVISFEPDEAERAAHDIYGLLREADASGADLILATALPQEGAGFSVMNRMLKSASFHVIRVS